MTRTRRGEGSESRPGRSLPPGKTRTHCTGGWVAPGPVWTGAENFAPPPGFDPRSFQPVASRYTDYATRPTLYCRVLYYVILYCTILHYTILYCTILYYTTLHYTILHYTTLHYTTLYYTILYYTHRWYSAF